MARLTVPIVACVIGEGGSGGAIAIALADRVLMQENAIYSVISPEGCAAILWRDAGEAQKAAAALQAGRCALPRARRDRRDRARARGRGAERPRRRPRGCSTKSLVEALDAARGHLRRRARRRRRREVPGDGRFRLAIRLCGNSTVSTGFSPDGAIIHSFHSR